MFSTDYKSSFVLSRMHSDRKLMITCDLAKGQISAKYHLHNFGPFGSTKSRTCPVIRAVRVLDVLSRCLCHTYSAYECALNWNKVQILWIHSRDLCSTRSQQFYDWGKHNSVIIRDLLFLSPIYIICRALLALFVMFSVHIFLNISHKWVKLLILKLIFVIFFYENCALFWQIVICVVFVIKCWVNFFW